MYEVTIKFTSHQGREEVIPMTFKTERDAVRQIAHAERSANTEVVGQSANIDRSKYRI